MRVEYDYSGDLRSRNPRSKQINDEDPRSDEKDASRRVKGVALLSGKLGGDLGGGIRVRVLRLKMQEYGILLGWIGGEDKEGALFRSVDGEERDDELGEGETGGENDETAIGVL